MVKEKTSVWVQDVFTVPLDFGWFCFGKLTWFFPIIKRLFFLNVDNAVFLIQAFRVRTEHLKMFLTSHWLKNKEAIKKNFLVLFVFKNTHDL